MGSSFCDTNLELPLFLLLELAKEPNHGSKLLNQIETATMKNNLKT
jgi:hypothetical protein